MSVEPWGWITLDIVEPLTRTTHSNKYLLMAIDLCTRFPEAIPVKSIDDAKSLVDPLFQIFSHHGILNKILKDQGSNFMGHLFQHLCRKLGISHVSTTPYRPQRNGCLERFHGT